MHFRKLAKEDAAAYWKLRLEAVELEPRSFGPTPEEHHLVTLEEIETLINGPTSFLIGAFDGEILVGFARLERATNAKERHKGHVRGVYVAVSHRGQGAAKAMIGMLIDEVKQDPSIEQLMLAVGVFNAAAREVYTSLGFMAFGIEPGGLKVGDEYVDEEHMILLLRGKRKPIECGA